MYKSQATFIQPAKPAKLDKTADAPVNVLT